jgi:H3 lysine-79-specific histone-lysine N-methyltransferase
MNKKKYNTLIENFIDELYKDISGFSEYIPEDPAKDNQSLISYTYGEISSKSIRNLLDELKITKNDVFVDLGSGIGKVSLQVYLATEAKAVYGIEISSIRHNDGTSIINIVKELQPELFDSNRQLIFLNDDFLNFSFDIATVLFMCSTCFNKELMEHLTEKINNATNIKTVVSLKALHGLERLCNSRLTKVDCSWSENVDCYIYEIN